MNYILMKNKTISTQTRLALNQNEGIQPIEHSIEIPVEDIFTKDGEDILSFSLIKN